MQSFPEAFQTINEIKFRGDFIHMVINDKLRNEQLDNCFAQQWNDNDATNRYRLTQINIQQESASPASFEFIRQDHVAFWNHKFNGSHHPLPAILITDTGNKFLQ